MIDITALILTYDEEQNIARTLQALAWVSRVIVIDSFSIEGRQEPNVRPAVIVVDRTEPGNQGGFG